MRKILYGTSSGLTRAVTLQKFDLSRTAAPMRSDRWAGTCDACDGLVRVRIFELRLVMEVQGASRTLRDAVGYRSRRFLRRQREISQVFFWDLYDGGEDRLDLLASNPFLEPCLQRYAPLTF